VNRVRRRPPIAVVVLAVVAVLFFALPLVGLIRQASWSTFGDDLGSPEARDAIVLSLICSLSAAALSLIFGLPLAWCLARLPFPGKGFIRALVLLPLVLPPVVGGVALLSAFSKTGILGEHLFDWFGIQFTFTTGGAILAETFVALPFFVITVEAALRSMDVRYEDVAATLGAGRWTVFRRVTLPLVFPSVVAGAVLSWARALGEFGATITFAGNIQGETQTLPLSIYLLHDTRPTTAVALSLLLLGMSLIVIVLLRDRWLDRA
jgi:molybdate transport system permease protein